MSKLVLYIDGEVVDLFKDEQVTIFRSVQNIRDISKVFGDFTQSFTVPASKKNNTIFKHWYNADIVGGFVANLRVTSNIEINHLPFKDGKIELEKVKLKNGKVDSYQLTFYGNIVKLTDLFGDDHLSDLDLTAYDHDFTGANVKAGMVGSTLLSGNIVYPTYFRRNVNVDTLATSLSDDDLLFYSGGQTTGIKFRDLNPAIRINRLIDAIEVKYGVTFSNDFFVNSNHTEQLYLLLRNTKGILICDEEEETVKLDNIIFTDGNYSISTGQYTYAGTALLVHNVTITATVDSFNIPFTLTLYKNSTVIKTVTSFSVISFAVGVSGVIGDTTEIKITFDTTFAYTGNFNNTLVNVSAASTFTATPDVSIGKNLPKLKVQDFLTSIFNMFNIVIVPTGSTTFDILPLDDWYAAGSTEDITKYIDVSKFDVNRPRLNRQINFNYQPTETIIGDAFFKNNSIYYGDLENSFSFDGGTLDIEVVFENIVSERLTKVLTKTLSNIHVAKLIDSDLEEITTEPVLFYTNGTYSPTNNLAFLDEKVTVFSISTIGLFNQYSSSSSINWGSEIDTFTLTTKTESLYLDFWSDYVSDLYDTQRRVYNYEATLPVGIIITLELNDLVIIQNRKYRINNMNINLNTGKTKLVLLNEV